MTDTIDVAALVERLNEVVRSAWKDKSGDWHITADDGDVRKLCKAATIALSQAELERDAAVGHASKLLQAAKEDLELMRATAGTVQSLTTRATTAEASLATMREALEEWRAAHFSMISDIDTTGEVSEATERRLTAAEDGLLNILGGSNAPAPPATPTLSDRTAILRRLADGDRIVYSRDGDDAWMSGGDRAFVASKSVLELRAMGFLERAGDPETDGEHDRLSPAGRAALAKEGK